MKGNSIIFCQIQGHQEQVLKYICINKNCVETMCCDDCLTQTHQSHIKDCLDLNQLYQNLEQNLQTQFKKISENTLKLCNFLEEKSEKIFGQLKITFSNTLQNDELINCQDYVKTKKYQILQFLDISNFFEQKVLKLQQLMTEIDDQMEIISQNIFESQNKIKIITQQFKKELQNKEIVTLRKNNQQTGLNIQTIESFQQEEQKIKQKKIIFLDSSESENDSYQEDEIQTIQQKENAKVQQQLDINVENFVQQDVLIYDCQEYYNLENELIQTKKLYTDTQTNNCTFFQATNYNRISQIIQQPINFFYRPQCQNVFASNGIKVKPQDIIQQAYQYDFFYDLMYFVASFCPSKLQDVFISKKFSPQGIYAIKLNDTVNYQSAIVTIIIDDYIPYTTQDNFQACKQICFYVLKKALAKLHGGYHIFLLFRYLKTITSLFDCTYIPLNVGQDQFFEKVRQEIQCQSLILFNFFNKPINSQTERVYQILDLIEVLNLFDEIVVLFKIKTSQSRYHYKGEWGFQSPLWTDDLKLKLQISEEDDGVFYMDSMSFLQQAQELYSIRINQQLFIHQNFILRTNQGAYFSLDLNENQNLAFLLILDEKEEVQELFQYFKILITHAETFSIEKSSLVYKTIAFQQILSKGKYIIYIKCPSDTIKTLQCIIQIYGSQQIKLNQIQKIENYKNIVFEKQIEKAGKNIHDNQLFLALNLNLQSGGWNIYKFFNKSENPLRFKLEFNNFFEKRILCKPYIYDQIQQVIQKGKTIMFIIKTYPFIQKNIFKPSIQINDQIYPF